MLCAKTKRIGGFAALTVFSALFALCEATPARADPPTSIPAGGPFGYDPNAIAFNSWLFYPSVNFLAENSNNYFIASGPQPKLSGWAFAWSPTLTAEWSNGIHTTTLFGTFQQLQYPPDNANPPESNIPALSGEATWTQQYAPLRDLNFTFVADYNHQTLQAGLTNAIPSPVAFSGAIVLPNGNIELPNGIIISPTGQVVGQIGPTVTVSPTSFVNPYDIYTATGKIEKIFSEGIVDLGASISRTDYENQGSADYTNKTFTENGSFWLGSVLYAYSNGAYSIRNTDPSSIPGNNSTAYSIVGGIGTRQVGLFRASAYFGHQGSGASGAASSGGNVYGGALSYYPTPALTISANVDETINLAPAGAPPSNQAIGLPGITPLQVATSSSSQTTAASLHASYTINLQWSVNALFGFVHIENIGSPIWDNSYVVDAQLAYQMWRNLTLTWEYQNSNIVTNQPMSNAARNLITMSATYKF